MGKEILTKNQLAFLEAIKRSELTETFSLTGGTALAAFYLNHRESEDLDFFSQTEIDPLAIEVFLKSKKAVLQFERFEFQRSFNRNLFFLHFSAGLLKTEFTYFPFAPVTQGIRDGALRIDSLRDIAVNKTFLISQQTRARDFVDLFFICREKGWTLRELLQDARIKFDAHIDFIQLGGQLMRVGDLKDMPRMRVILDPDEFESFFLGEAADLKKYVFSE